MTSTRCVAPEGEAAAAPLRPEEDEAAPPCPAAPVPVFEGLGGTSGPLPGGVLVCACSDRLMDIRQAHSAVAFKCEGIMLMCLGSAGKRRGCKGCRKGQG